jgi:hypothetical protein
LLFLLIIGNRFLKNRFQFFINFCHRRTNNRCCTMGTGESITDSATTLPCVMGVTAAGTEKNGSATIGVGTQTRFSSSRISRGTVLP